MDKLTSRLEKANKIRCLKLLLRVCLYVLLCQRLMATVLILGVL